LGRKRCTAPSMVAISTVSAPASPVAKWRASAFVQVHDHRDAGFHRDAE
jgi:hypothetical protein